MTKLEAKGCIYLMGKLWQNYRVPASETDMAVTVNVWMQFFRSIPEREVSRAIMEISADGGDFAPQIGQIYARLRKSLPNPQFIPEDYCNFQTYARVRGIEPPEEGMGPDGWWRWFQEVRRDISLCDS